MVEPILKLYWFKITYGWIKEKSYISCASKAGEAFDCFRILAKNGEFTQLTWQELSELTGCLIPCQCKPADFANGKLMFMRKGCFITVW